VNRPEGSAAEQHGPGAAPVWLSRLGWSGWMTVGAVAGAAAVIVVLGILLPVLTPVVITVVLAAALEPLVARLRRRGAPPAVAALVGALLVPVILVLLAVLMVHAVLAGVPTWTHNAADAGQHLRSAVGADPLSAVLQSAQWRTALFGLGSALLGSAALIAQVAIGVLLGAYLLFFIFKDGPRLVEFLDRRLPVGPGVTRELLDSAALRLRLYALGTTLVAATDALVVTLGAVALRLPLLGMIAVVTFLTAYVPYVGGWVSAAFAAIVALGSGGPGTALWMLVIALLAQNAVEGVLRPYVFGRTLALHPVAVLGVTVIGAALGGLVGAFLAPPLAAIVVSWRATLRETTTST
jgi:predicted PurR-regulated permease PerM